MITPLVEKAILNGHGTLRNYAVGVGGLMKVEIPQNHFAILLSFSYEPITFDATYAPGSNGQEFQEICFYSNNKSYKYVHKINYHNRQIESITFKGYERLPIIDTYFYIDSDLYIQLKFIVPQTNDGFAAINFNQGNMVNSQSPAFPETAGNSLSSTIKSVQNTLGWYYYPCGNEDANLTLGSDGTSTMTGTTQDTVEWQMLINGGYPSNTPADFNKNCPLLNLQLLVVPEQNRQYL